MGPLLEEGFVARHRTLEGTFKMEPRVEEGFEVRWGN